MTEPKHNSGNADSLVAAIDGNLSGMAKADLVLTCEMLERGRAQWRKEAEELKDKNEALLAACEAAEMFLGMLGNDRATAAIELANRKSAPLKDQLRAAIKLAEEGTE